MSVPAATAAGRSRTAGAPATGPAPLRLPPAPRRVSGPARHPRAASAPPVVASARWLSVIDHPWLDRLIRGRAWIAIVAAALLGIVAVQVVLLRLGAQISAETTQVNSLIAHNETVSATIAGMEASGGAYGASATAKMVDPPPDDVTYMHANSGDAARAAAIMTSPSAAAIEAEAAARTVTAAQTITPPAASSTATTHDHDRGDRRHRRDGERRRHERLGDHGRRDGCDHGRDSRDDRGDQRRDSAAATGRDQRRHERSGEHHAVRRHRRRRHHLRRRGRTDAGARDLSGWRRGGAGLAGRLSGGALSHALGHRRIGWLLLVFTVLLAVGLARALQLTTLDSAHLAGIANNEHAATISVPAARGEILDRNGSILAVTEAADDITASPRQLKDPAGAAAKLAPLLNTSQAAIEAKFAHPSSPNYTVLESQVPAAIAQQVKALSITGIALVSNPRRVYPNRYLAGAVLGGVHSSGVGAGGVEAEYNKALTGTPGIQHVVYDAHGQPIGESGAEPVAGKTVQLTLDVAIQKKVEQVLLQTAETFNPQLETAIVLDPRTNAILADASWPRRSGENFAIQLTYEPGSTFKVVPVSGALADGIISPGTKFVIPYAYHVADRVIHDSDYHPTEIRTTGQILAQSLNVGAVQIGQKLARRIGHQSLLRLDGALRLRRAHRHRPPGEEQGIVPTPQQWSGSSIGNLPIGQGESVTPIQMATAYSAIADGGLIRAPHIVQSVAGVPRRLPAAHRISRPTIANELKGMLEGVFGRPAPRSEIHIPGYQLAGKTGTANMVVNGTYSNKDYVASFVGFAPASDPQIEAIVVVQQPEHGLRLRDRGRGAGVGEHHELRAAVPEDPVLSRGRSS